VNPPLILEKGRGRLIFTPETGGLILEHDGAGLTHLLSIEDCHALAVMLILSIKKRKRG
jgi:hypothetical protein